MPIKGGYILQPRCLDEGSIAHNPPIDRELWAYLLRNVSHSDNGNLKRGQGFFKLDDIREALHWKVGYRKEMYSKSQISKSLSRLYEGNTKETTKATTKETMLEVTKATRGIVVTICNYDYYQDPKNYEGNYNSDHEGNNEGNHERTTNGHTKNKNVKNIISSSAPTAHAREGEVLDDSEQDPNTTLPQIPKSCAKKVETLPRLPDNDIEYIPVAAVAEYLKGDTSWLEAICMNKHLELGYVTAKIDEFAKELQNQGETAKDKRDCKRHFNNWLRKNRELNEPRTTTNTSRRPAADITNDEIDRRCAERVAQRLARAETYKVGT